MENKQIITPAGIKKHLLKTEIFTLIVLLIIAVPVFYWTFFKENNPIARILALNCFLLALYYIGLSIHNIIRLQNNTLFKIRTDILVDKEEHIYSFLRKRPLDRLLFQNGRYDIDAYSRYTGDAIADKKVIFDTASIGDSFTLICVRKTIVLAFNDKFYEIQEGSKTDGQSVQ